MSGSLVVVGLGPGSVDLLTPAATRVLRAATDLVGYGPYLDRISEIVPGQRRHPSDNRVEIERARLALTLAAEGGKVAVVSGGDPGVFAMAAAVFEAIEGGDPNWRELDIRVEPGITAVLAAAAEVGAPLGGDFCAISLSDNLKSWETVERRLRAAAEADFVIALYNPASKARPHQLGRAFELLRTIKSPQTVVVFVKRAATPETTCHRNGAGRSGCGGCRYAHARHHRGHGNAAHAPKRTAALGLYAAGGTRGRAMSKLLFKPFDSALGIFQGVPARLMRTRYHHDRNSKLARCLDLRDGRRSARVLGNKYVDLLMLEKCRFCPQIERTSAKYQTDIGRKRNINRRLDHARDIVMVRALCEGAKFEATKTKKNSAGLRPERIGGSFRAGNGKPGVARLTLPGGAYDRGQRNRQPSTCGHDIGRDLIGVRMRRVDDGLDGFLLQPCGKSVDTAEAANPSVNGLDLGIRSAPGKRERQFQSDGRRQADAPDPRLPSCLRE